MKKSFNLIKFLGIAFIICFAFNSVLLSQYGKRYEFPSAFIIGFSETDAPGVKISTIDSIYIDGHGNKQVTFRTEKQIISAANMVTEKKTVTIIDGDLIINYDPETRQGTKMKLNVSDKFSGMSEEDM